MNMLHLKKKKIKEIVYIDETTRINIIFFYFWKQFWNKKKKKCPLFIETINDSIDADFRRIPKAEAIEGQTTWRSSVWTDRFPGRGAWRNTGGT